MALTDRFPPADLLESLGWMGLPHKVRVAKVAALFLQKEHTIDNESKSYSGPNKSNVGVFIKSLFKPPRGLANQTIEDTIAEIKRQRALRTRRAENRPLKTITRRPKRGFQQQQWVQKRMNNIAKGRYVTLTHDYEKKLKRCAYNIVAIGRVGDCLLILDKAGYYAKPRLYIRHNPTGREKVVVLSELSKSGNLTSALLKLAPKVSLRAMFGGESITLDFDGEGFIINGKSHPWRNVIRVYTRKGKDGLIRTMGNPVDQD